MTRRRKKYTADKNRAGKARWQAAASGHDFYDQIILPKDPFQKSTCSLTAGVSGGGAGVDNV